jgi:hypothetical protein
MKKLTLDEALAYVPTHTFLNPGDPLVAGDEYINNYTNDWEMENRGRSLELGKPLYVGDDDEERMVVEPEVIWRRPVPDDVRYDLAKTIVFLSESKTKSSVGSPDLSYAKWLLAVGRAGVTSV